MRDPRFTVGGVLDLAALSALADQHRPDDVDSLRREARRLAADGLTAVDIGQALHLSPGAVAALLNHTPEDSAGAHD